MLFYATRTFSVGSALSPLLSGTNFSVADPFCAAK
jgi:hypothetical protein